jgi:hypothetical protein
MRSPEPSHNPQTSTMANQLLLRTKYRASAPRCIELPMWESNPELGKLAMLKLIS